MKVVCYECGLLWTGLLWTCSVSNGLLWVVCYEQVDLEREPLGTTFTSSSKHAFVVIRKGEQQVRKASHCGTKQHKIPRRAHSIPACSRHMGVVLHAHPVKIVRLANVTAPADGENKKNNGCCSKIADIRKRAADTRN